MFPVVHADEVGWLTEAQMIEVDRVMIEDLRIELIQMMENAGRNLAELVLRLHAPSCALVMVGSGGNGGGGMVAARHLANRGVEVQVLATRSLEDLTGVPRQQMDALSRMGVPVVDSVAGEPSVIVDALIGYSLRGAPQGRAQQLIRWANESSQPVVSLDAPSGLDVTDGSTPGVVIDADATLTLALPKVGLKGSPHVGELYVADISVPAPVYTAMAAQPPDFSASTILHVKGV